VIGTHTFNMDTERSFERLTEDDLAHLSEVAQDVVKSKVSRAPVAGRYVDRLIMLALCQGAAQHYVDGRNGVKDLDVWAFFRSGLKKPFPYRAHWRADFGPSHLGRHPDDRGYNGRRVDILGRSILAERKTDDEGAICAWLHSGSKSAKYLVKRPVIGLFPKKYFGKLVWSPSGCNQA